VARRVNRLLLERAQAALGDEAKVGFAAVGYAGPHPTTMLVVLLAGAAVIVLLLGLTTGVLFVPGAIPMVAVRYYVGKLRLVASTDQGLALFTTSFWSGKPTGVVARIAHPPPGQPSQGSWAQLDFGRERVWVRPERLVLSGPQA